jgi:tetratricopeptide (TPR) repeat protein
MKNTLSIAVFAIFSLLIACDQSNPENSQDDQSNYMPLDKMNIESLNAEIERREKALSEDTNAANSQKAAQLMEAYAVYAEKFSNYQLAADRLFKAGELAMGLGHKVKAIKYFDKVYLDYRDYEKRPYALFMKAFVLENQAAQYDQAKEIYQAFIEEFPDHPMADDAQYSIENMGKSPEELIREFEKRDSLDKARQAA